MARDAVDALVEGMTAAKMRNSQALGGSSKGRRISLSLHSASTASMSAGSASEALGEECWNLMEILVGNLYDPDEQVPMCHAANKRSFRCSLLLYFLAISSFRCDVL